MRKNKGLIRLITFAVIFVFLCQDIVWTQGFLQFNSAFDKHPRNNGWKEEFEREYNRRNGGPTGNDLPILFLLSTLSNLDSNTAVIFSLIFFAILYFRKPLARIIRSYIWPRIVSIILVIVMVLSSMPVRAEALDIFSGVSSELTDLKNIDPRNLSFEELEDEISVNTGRINNVLKDIGINIPEEDMAYIFASLLYQESRCRQFDGNGNVVTSRKNAKGIAQISVGKEGVLAEMAWLLRVAIRNVVENKNGYSSNIIKIINEALFNKELTGTISIWEKRVRKWIEEKRKRGDGKEANLWLKKRLRVLETQIYHKLRMKFNIIDSSEDNLKVGYGYLALLIYRIINIKGEDGNTILERYPNFPYIAAAILAYNAGYPTVENRIKRMLNGEILPQELFEDKDLEPSIRRHTELIIDFYNRLKGGPKKAPGPQWTDEDRKRFEKHFAKIIKTFLPKKIITKDKIFNAIEIMEKLAGGNIDIQKVDIYTIDMGDMLGIPKEEGKTKPQDLVYAYGEMDGGVLKIYVTQRYWDECLSQTPLHLAEIIDHEWDEYKKGKSHVEACKRMWKFKNETGLDPFSVFYLNLLVKEGEYNELYNLAITPHGNDPDNKFGDYAKGILYKENKNLKEKLATADGRMKFSPDEIEKKVADLNLDRFGPGDIVLVRFSYSTFNLAIEVINKLLIRGCQVRTYIYDPELGKIIGADSEFSIETYKEEARGVVDVLTTELRQRVDQPPVEESSLSLEKLVIENELLREKILLDSPTLPYPEELLEKIASDLLDTMKIAPGDILFLRPHIAHLPVAREIARLAKEIGARVVYSIVSQEINKVIIDNFYSELTEAEGPLRQVEKATVAIGFNLISSMSFIPATGREAMNSAFREKYIIPVLKGMRKERRSTLNLTDPTGVAVGYGLDMKVPIGLSEAIRDYLKNYKNAANRDLDLVRKGLRNLAELGNKATEIIVEADDGTRLEIEMLRDEKNGRYFQDDTKGISYPFGEVCGEPVGVEGEIFFPEAFLDIQGVGKYLMKNLKLTIVTQDIGAPRYAYVKDFSVDDPQHEEKLQGFFDKNFKNRIIGEFAIGTASGIKAMWNDILLLEKMIGIHIALGKGNVNFNNGADWHCDIVKQNVDVKFKIDGEWVHILSKENRFVHPALEYLNPNPNHYLIIAYDIVSILRDLGIVDVDVNIMNGALERCDGTYLKSFCEGMNLEEKISLFGEFSKTIRLSPEFWGLFFWPIFEGLKEDELLNIADRRIEWISIFAWRELARRGSVKGFEKLFKAFSDYYPSLKDIGESESEKAYFFCIYFTYNIGPLLERLKTEDIDSPLFNLLDTYYNNDKYGFEDYDDKPLFIFFRRLICFDLRQLKDMRDFYNSLDNTNDPTGMKREKLLKWWRELLLFRIQPETDPSAVNKWACRRTFSDRLNVVNEMIVGNEEKKGLLKEFSWDKDIKILDTAVSDGTSTIELEKAIKKTGKEVSIVGTDKHLFVYRMDFPNGESRVFLYNPGIVKDNYIMQSIYPSMLGYFFTPFSDKPYKVEEPIPDVEEISLVNPVAEGSDIKFKELDIFEPIEEKYDIIRCFGLLIPGEEKGYYSDEKIKEGVINLGLALKENGVLLIGSVGYEEGDPLTHFIAFRRIGDRLVKLSKVGDFEAEPVGYEGIFDEDFIELSSPDFPDAEGVSARYLVNMEKVKKDVEVLTADLPTLAEEKAIIVRDINDFVKWEQKGDRLLFSHREQKGDRLLFSHRPGIKAILDKVKNSDGTKFAFMAKPQEMQSARSILNATGLLGDKISLYEYTNDIVEEAKERIGNDVDKRRIVYFVKPGYNLTDEQRNRISSGHLKIIESAGGESNFYSELLFAIIYARTDRDERDILLNIMKRLDMDIDKLESIIMVRFIRNEEVLRELENQKLYVDTST